MGAFAIIRRDKRRQRKEVENKVRASFRVQGFNEPGVFETEFALILLYPKLGAGQLNAVTGQGGDFAFYTGTLVHQGKSGEAALRHLLTGPPERHLNGAGLSGAYALIINNRRGLRLILNPFGAYKVYTDDDNIVWSSSFLAVLATIEKPLINTQAVYEYVFTGAAYGRSTVVRQISTLDSGLGRIGRIATFQANSPPTIPVPEPGPQNAFIEKNIALLRERTQAYTKAFGGNIDMALTGDYSTRLMLALAREAGAAPRLHVYGEDGDADVKIAKIIAQGEELTLLHINKNMPEKAFSPDAFAEIVEDRFQIFDGCPHGGIFGNSKDLAAQRAGTARGRLMLNNGGSGIYRNFFALPNRSFTPRELLWSFWRQFDVAACTRKFHEDIYLTALESKMREILPASSRFLKRSEIEYLYPAFEGRFRESRHTGVNLRACDAADLFLDTEIIRAAAAIPFHYKCYGQFEAALIAAIDPKLLAYPFTRGRAEATLLPQRHLIAEWLSTLRPPLIRRHGFTWHSRFTKPGIPWYLDTSYIKAALPQGLRLMPDYFHHRRLHNAAQLNRMLTLEYLFQKVGARHP